MENGLEPTEQELHEDYFRYFLVKQNVKKREKTAIIEEDKSAEEQAEEAVMEGRSYETSGKGGEIHTNEDGGDNEGKKCGGTTLRKARKKCGNDWNSELRALMREEPMRKTIREEVNAAFCPLRDVIMTILTQQPSNAAETDFDKQAYFKKLKNNVFNGAEVCLLVLKNVLHCYIFLM